MQQDRRQSISLILRRFIHPRESIELAVENTELAPRQSTSFRIWSGEDDEASETRAYGVTLPDNVFIRPVDWRRFAYDHERVASLVRSCAYDNFWLVYCDLELSPEEYVSRFEHVLMRALQDLSSIFDARSVECELQDDHVLMQVAGDFKNGEATVIYINLQVPT